MSKQTLTGVLAELSAKDWQDRETGDNIVLRSFKIEGDNRWFRTGTKPVNANEGDAIQFVFEAKGNKATDIQVIDASEVRTPPKPAAGAKSFGSGSKGKGGENWDARGKYWDEKAVRDIEVVEPRITYAAAARDAITVVVAALQNDCLALGQTKGKRLDLLLDQVDFVAKRFYDARINGTFKEDAE